MTIKILFNVSQLNSMPQFSRTNFQEVNYNERAFITIKEKKRDLRFFDHVSCRILLEKNKHLQRKGDQWLVFAVKQQKFSSFRLNIVNEKLTQTLVKNRLFSLQCDIKYAFEERCCFLTFSFEGKFRKYISVKRKHTKTNEKK